MRQNKILKLKCCVCVLNIKRIYRFDLAIHYNMHSDEISINLLDFEPVNKKMNNELKFCNEFSIKFKCIVNFVNSCSVFAHHIYSLYSTHNRID